MDRRAPPLERVAEERKWKGEEINYVQLDDYNTMMMTCDELLTTDNDWGCAGDGDAVVVSLMDQSSCA